jgi:hypothetical protein
MRKILVPLALLFLSVLCLSQEIISWKDAVQYYGQVKTVEGTIVVKAFAQQW